MGKITGSKGATVTGVIIILAVLTSLGLVFVSLFTTGVEKTTAGVSSLRALYIAEGGAESAIGRLKKSPSPANWLWNGGYKGKTLGAGTVDVEVLEYDSYPAETSVSPYCVVFSSVLVNTGVNPARTILVTVLWDPSVNPSDLGVELYNTDLVASGTCASPGSSPVAASVTARVPETIRYRLPEPATYPATVTYTVRVLGNTGGAHSLMITHPDKPGFSIADDTRSVIATGKSGDSRREIFISFRRQAC